MIPLVDRSQRVEDALARVGINGSEATFNWTVKRLRTAAANDSVVSYMSAWSLRLWTSRNPSGSS